MCKETTDSSKKNRVGIVGDLPFPKLTGTAIVLEGWMERNLLRVFRRNFSFSMWMAQLEVRQNLTSSWEIREGR